MIYIITENLYDCENNNSSHNVCGTYSRERAEYLKLEYEERLIVYNKITEEFMIFVQDNLDKHNKKFYSIYQDREFFEKARDEICDKYGIKPDDKFRKAMMVSKCDFTYEIEELEMVE